MWDDRIFDAAFIYLFIENAETIRQPTDIGYLFAILNDIILNQMEGALT